MQRRRYREQVEMESSDSLWQPLKRDKPKEKEVEEEEVYLKLAFLVQVCVSSPVHAFVAIFSQSSHVFGICISFFSFVVCLVSLFKFLQCSS